MSTTMASDQHSTAMISHAPGKEKMMAIAPFGGSAPSIPDPDRDVLGGKGLGLQEMSSIGIDVPPGFTLTTPLCQVYEKLGDLPQDLWHEVDKAIARVEKDMGRKFGSAENPLLFSCRSGAKISMPGMMDTVLNVGLTKETVEGLATSTGNRRFAYDAYRRLLDMFGDVSMMKGLSKLMFFDQLLSIAYCYVSFSSISLSTRLSSVFRTRHLKRSSNP